MPIVAVAGLAPASGKTTTVVHLAEQLGALGARVVIVDLSPDADALAAVRAVRTVDLRQVLKDGSSLDACLAGTRLERVDVLTLPEGRPADLFPLGSVEKDLSDLLRRLAGRYTYVVIDLAPAADLETRAALNVADLALIPVPLEEESLADVPETVELVDSIRPTSNPDLRFRLLLTLDRETPSSRDVAQILRDRYPSQVLRSRIPEDSGLNALLDGMPRTGLPSAGINAFHRLAQEIAGMLSAAPASSSAH